MSYRYDLGIVIGRFQPFTNAHNFLLREALAQSSHVIVVVGSANRARSTSCPFTTEQVHRMIGLCVTENDNKRVHSISLTDYRYNEAKWLAEAQNIVHRAACATIGSPSGWAKIGLFGVQRDDSTDYLQLFPQWELSDVGAALAGVPNVLESEAIIAQYFTPRAEIKGVPAPVATFMDEFRATAEYKALCDEYGQLLAYKASWANAPFPPVFVTTDAVVVKSGHVLVVKRKGTPGRGLMALPGGFLNAKERIIDGCVRELREETGIKLSIAELKNAVKGSAVFDDPRRSTRGRTITHAFYIDLGSGSLPRVKGGDDAAKAWWMPLKDVMSSPWLFFEDHFDIVNHFTA